MLVYSITRTFAFTTWLSSNSLFASATPQNNEENALLQTCLTNSAGGDATRAHFSSGENFSTEYVKPYNRQYPYTPFAVMYPNTAEEVGEMVKCASENNRKVQARSGGHDYVNKCIGGADGAVVIDLKNLNQLTVDGDTHIATIGPANGLKAVMEGLHNNGKRMIPHGTSATVGIGGHTTVGGFGPATRRDGLTLDSLRSVEVVLANGTVVRASSSAHPDLFWAMRGAGQSFGIAISFEFDTKPQPPNVVTYQYNITSSDSTVLAESLQAWQALVADPALPRDLYTFVILQGPTLLVRGTFLGTRAAFDALRLHDRVPNIAAAATTVSDASWLDTYTATFRFTDNLLADAFFAARTAAVPAAALPANDTLAALITHLRAGSPGPAARWWVLIDANGGAAADVAPDATAYPHRGALYYFQLYVASQEQRIGEEGMRFADGAVEALQAGRYGVYAGYPDAGLEEPQKKYWAGNLARLEEIKGVVDPWDVFSTGHGVKPARG